MLKNIGDRIRKLRKSKGITLVDLSKATGVAQATLSRIETGTMTGTIESHEKIAAVIGVGLSELYTGVDGRYDEISHLKQDAPRKVFHQSKDTQIELLTQESSKKNIAPLLLTIQPGREAGIESNERGVEKFLFQLEGEIEVTVDQESFILKKEESLYFDASLPHKLTNNSDKASRTLVVVSPATI